MVTLKEKKIWVCFIVKCSDDGKRKEKMPISANGTPTGCSPEYEYTWTTYDEAMDSVEQHGYDGVGFAVPPGVFFLDIDHRNRNDSLVQKFLKRFDTYAEYSVSGEGFHVYGKCDMTRIPVEVSNNGQVKLSREFYTKNPKSGIELYIGGITNRFSLFTGNVICDKPIADCTDAILQTLELDMRRPFVGEKDTDANKRESQAAYSADDIGDIVASLKAQKNGNKFSSLYDRGDTSAYRSHSEADAALCAMVAFRVGNNPKMIDEVFRTSALYRKKWERQDYRINTIEVGINACHGTFYAPSNQKRHKKDSRVVERPAQGQNENYTPDHESKTFEPKDYSDVGQATVFSEHYKDLVRYSNATDYLVYNGMVWREASIRAQGLSQELTERQIAEAKENLTDAEKALNAAYQKGDEKLIEIEKMECAKARDYHKYVLSRRKTERIRATLIEARPKLEVSVTELDADGYLLNTPGGTVDLRTGEIKPHKPTDYITKITSVYPDNMNAEVFENFLRELTCGDDDLARYLQEVAGMCVIGRVMQENIIIAYGAGGNGKSTLFNLLARVIGDYSGALSADTLTSNCRRNKMPEYADLRGKRLVIAAELEEGMRLDTSVVKKLCSTDRIIAEKKYKDPFTFIPSHTVVLYTNYLPKIGTMDRGTWDRIIAVPFNARFRNRQGEIKNMSDYLYDRCAGAVLTWMIEGARTFIDNGYFIKIPECVRNLTEKYQSDSDWFNTFLTENCDVAREYCEKSGDLYVRYREFCDITGDFKRSLAEFKKSLNAHGFESKRTNKGTFVTGLRLSG